jgi:hypothetical protein
MGSSWRPLWRPLFALIGAAPPRHELMSGAFGASVRGKNLSRRRRLRRIRSLTRAAAGFAVFEVGGSAPDTPIRCAHRE